jgi:hypothetical protein
LAKQLTHQNRTTSRELSGRETAEAGCICAIVRLPLPPPVEDQARQRLLSSCPYAFCFRDIRFEFTDGVLTLRGQVPTFYLKQMLQTFLRGLGGVQQINNQVDVISATGLSSEPRETSASDE